MTEGQLDGAINMLWVFGGALLSIGLAFLGFGKRQAMIASFAGAILFGLLALGLQVFQWARPNESGPLPKPIISITPQEVTDFAPGYRTGVKLRIRNVGNATAYDATADVSVAILPFPLPSNEKTPKVAAIHKSRADIRPGDDLFGLGQFDLPLSQSWIDTILDGSVRRLYAAGIVSYRLSSGKRCEQHFFAAAGGPEFAASMREFQRTPKPVVQGWLLADRFNDLTPGC